MSSTAAQKPPRKFPPPCWSRDEALLLIDAYRERWNALHRAFLRTPDWDTVAEKLATASPDVTPPKTSAQCRHKMEKLRQRHRVEKQRAAEFPGDHFFSTWFYYDAMETMEHGSDGSRAGTGAEPGFGTGTTVPNPGSGKQVQVKPLPLAVDYCFPTLAPNSTKRRTKHNPNPNPNFSSTTSNRYAWNQEPGYYDRAVEDPGEHTMVPVSHRGREVINHKKVSGGASRVESVRPGLRPRKYSKVVNDDDEEEDDEDEDDGGMWVKVPRGTNSTKSANGMNSIPKGKNVNGNGNGKKRRGGVEDVVASIRILGEGFMKVEKMKMDLAREIEEMRMETEMRRNEVMLEAQKRVVDAFVEGLVGYRKMETMGDV